MTGGRKGRVAVLLNPAAGAGGARRNTDRALMRLNDRGLEVVVLEGETADESRRLARSALRDPDYGALVVAGGDGMVSLAINEWGLADTADTGDTADTAANGNHAEAARADRTPIGILPVGTGNDLAREYELPLGDPEAAADVIVDGDVESADLGLITAGDGTRRVFASIMCAGFDSIVNARVNAMSFPRGKGRYVVATALEYPGFHAIPMRITGDGHVLADKKVSLSAYAITRRYGGNMMIAPLADRHDGLLDIVYVDELPKLRGARNFAKVFSGDHIGMDEVGHHRVRVARVELTDPDRRLVAYADGEPVAPLPVEVSVLGGAGRFIVPRKP